LKLRLLLALGIIAGVVAVGCGKEEEPPPPAAAAGGVPGGVPPSKNENAGGAQADMPMAAPPGVKTGTP